MTFSLFSFENALKKVYIVDIQYIFLADHLRVLQGIHLAFFVFDSKCGPLVNGQRSEFQQGKLIVTGWWFQTFVIFIPIPGEMIQFDDHILQRGWFNHQLVYDMRPVFLS